MKKLLKKKAAKQLRQFDEVAELLGIRVHHHLKGMTTEECTNILYLNQLKAAQSHIEKEIARIENPSQVAVYNEND